VDDEWQSDGGFACKIKIRENTMKGIREEGGQYERKTIGEWHRRMNGVED
jgi:hypothetical protein